MLANDYSILVEYKPNKHIYNMGCYFADGIYPKWVTFMKPLYKP
jgi:hypothetical protein